MRVQTRHRKEREKESTIDQRRSTWSCGWTWLAEYTSPRTVAVARSVHQGGIICLQEKKDGAAWTFARKWLLTDVPFISSPRRHDARNNWTRSDHKFLGSPLNYTTLHLIKTAAYIGVRHANNSRLSRTFRTISRHTRSVYSHEVSLKCRIRRADIISWTTSRLFYFHLFGRSLFTCTWRIRVSFQNDLHRWS